MKINLNQKIKVKLAPFGKTHMRNRHAEIHKFCGEAPKFKLPEEDSEGYSVWQIWDFMGCFGEKFQYPTLSPPVDPDIYLIEQD